MGLGRSVLVALCISSVAAGIVAVVSCAPDDLRAPRPPTPIPAEEAAFSEAEVARHGAYRGPLYLAFALSIVVQVATLLLLRGAPLDALVGWAERVNGSWPVRTALVAVAITASLFLVALPLSGVRGLAIPRAWGVSNQDLGAWLADQAKVLGISFVLAAVAAIVFFAIVRWQPRWWWLWGAGAFGALSFLLSFLYPVAIAPLFNRFTPLDDPGLVTRIERLAGEAGVDVDQVVVADASRRTNAENAYVAGLGATKQVVLYDTLLSQGSEEETLFVVAHELAHERERHVLKGVGISALGLLVGFGCLALLVHRGPLLRWSGAGSLVDLRVLPALLLFALVAGLVAQPIQAAVSRSFERHADAIAFGLIGDTDPAVGAFRRLALSNLADLRPPAPAVWFFFSHPPLAERIAAARAQDRPKP